MPNKGKEIVNNYQPFQGIGFKIACWIATVALDIVAFSIASFIADGIMFGFKRPGNDFFIDVFHCVFLWGLARYHFTSNSGGTKEMKVVTVI